MSLGDCPTEIGLEPPASCTLPLPRWVAGHVGGCIAQAGIPLHWHGWAGESTPSLKLAEGEGGAILTVRIPQASRLPPIEFQRWTTAAYRTVAATVESLPAQHLVRVWNFIPEIQRQFDDGITRYMVFNAGRYAAYWDLFAIGSSLLGAVPTATGIGHDGDDLVIHALTAPQPGLHLENPRQISPCQYSQRYGPLPPCFARATAIPAPTSSGDEFLLLIGGTASVRGEESLHIGDVRGQTIETLRNISRLIDEAGAAGPSGGRNGQSYHIEHLRVYHDPSVDPVELEALVRNRFPVFQEQGFEMLQAHVCRQELLVEIESVLRFKPQCRAKPS